MKRIFTSLFLATFAICITAQVPQAELLGTWSDPTLPASNAHDNTYNEVWGLAVNDHEFAVIGSTFGTHIIDVTDPTQPTELFVVEGGTIGGAIIHRDFHDYEGYLYTIADEGSNTTLQIIDISDLPNSIEVVYDSAEYFSRSHNIFIDTSRARLYSLISNGTSFNFAPMRIFDISNPIDPQPIATVSSLNTYQISQVHDAYVQNDTAYLNLGPGGFAIVDYSDIQAPNVISILTPAEYPQSGYNHSGWLSENGDYYYMADENFGADMKVLDLRNLPDIEIPTLFNADSDNVTIPHNQIVYGGRLYVSYYFDGLQVYDLADPENPERILQYPTSTFPPTNGLYRGAWGVYPALPSGNILVSDMQNGLFVVDGRIPTSTNDLPTLQTSEVHPNPTAGPFTIDLSAHNGAEVNVRITDATGKIIATQTAPVGSDKLIITEQLPQGLYMISAASSEGVSSSSVVVSGE